MAYTANVLTLDVGKPAERKIITLQNKSNGEVLEIVRFYSRADFTLMEKPVAILSQVARVADGAAALINSLITLDALSADAWKAIVGDTGAVGAYAPLIDGYLIHSRIVSFMGAETNPDWTDADPENPAAPPAPPVG